MTHQPSRLGLRDAKISPSRDVRPGLTGTVLSNSKPSSTHPFAPFQGRDWSLRAQQPGHPAQRRTLGVPLVHLGHPPTPGRCYNFFLSCCSPCCVPPPPDPPKLSLPPFPLWGPAHLPAGGARGRAGGWRVEGRRKGKQKRERNELLEEG